MEMGKRDRARQAARGTKADPARAVMAGVTATSRATAQAPGMNSKRERLTRRIFLTVEVVLALVPIAYLGMSGLLNAGAAAMEGLQDQLRREPALLLAFIAACLQPFVAYLLRIAYRHYERGDCGYAGANLAVLLCAEMFLQNMLGIVGVAVLLWRVWRRVNGSMGAWMRERKIGGALADASGGLTVLVLAIICFSAQMRLG